VRKITLTDVDRQIYDTEIRPWLPKRIFDAHTHMFINDCHPRMNETMFLADDPLLVDVDLPWLQAWWKALLPGVDVRGMVMGFPTADVKMAEENRIVAAQCAPERYPFSWLVKPKDDLKQLEADIEQYRPAVLKPYMCFVEGKPMNDSTVTDLIPEGQLALADKYGLAIMLHVAKPQGMGDAENLRDINRLADKYPNCQFVLAHCGRCFITPNAELMVKTLNRADNIWMDTSAVCDAGVFLTVLKHYDRSKILFGTDLVTAVAFRGNYVRMGASWHVCTDAMVARPKGQAATAQRSTFAAYEGLAALCFALRFLEVSEAEREAIFFGNGERLYERYLNPTT
jgi:predicted TIM-barrel fold metal-dependent hydrolase